jgi:hypothetical protein
VFSYCFWRLLGVLRVERLHRFAEELVGPAIGVLFSFRQEPRGALEVSRLQ